MMTKRPRHDMPLSVALCLLCGCGHPDEPTSPTHAVAESSAGVPASSRVPASAGVPAPADASQAVPAVAGADLAPSPESAGPPNPAAVPPTEPPAARPSSARSGEPTATPVVTTKKTGEITDIDRRRRTEPKGDPFADDAPPAGQAPSSPAASRPRAPSLPNNRARRRGDAIVVDWRIAHNCGERPEPSAEVLDGGVRIDVAWRGRPTKCGEQWTKFRTTIAPAPAGAVEIVTPDWSTTVRAVP